MKRTAIGLFLLLLVMAAVYGWFSWIKGKADQAALKHSVILNKSITQVYFIQDGKLNPSIKFSYEVKGLAPTYRPYISFDFFGRIDEDKLGE
jgi:hypothetical protein